MYEIPGEFVKLEVERLRSLVEKLTEFEARSHDEKEALGIAEHVHDDLLPDFEATRVQAKEELDAGSLTTVTGEAYHAQLQSIEGALLEGFLALIKHQSTVKSGSAVESWLWAVQLSFGIHYISHVKSGSMGATGPVTMSHGGKHCIPPVEC